MILKDLQRAVEEKLSAITDEYIIETKLLLEAILGLTRIDFILNKDRVLDDNQLGLISDALDRRLRREPLQYILGSQEFMGFVFKVTPDVLIPRLDTESLVEYAQSLMKQLDGNALEILDIGTGSGAIAISLAKLLGSAHVTAVDISEPALRVAKENAILNSVEDRMVFLKSDLLNEVAFRAFDLIISNPPYIPEDDRVNLEPEVSIHEPGLALFESGDGLGLYRRMVPKAKDYLKVGGYLMFEAGHDQGDRIVEMMVAEGYQNVHLERDLRGIPRFIIGQKQ